MAVYLTTNPPTGGIGLQGLVTPIVTAAVNAETNRATAAEAALLTQLRAGLLTDVPEWQPSTPYTAGTFVLNPSGQVAQANSTFTSGASYNAANWTVVTITPAGVASLISAQAASDSATYPTIAAAAGTAAGLAIVFGS